MKLYYFFLFRSNGADIAFYFPEYQFIINSYAIEGNVKDIAQDSRSTVDFANKQVWWFYAPQAVKCIFPFTNQPPEFNVEISNFFTFGYGTDNNAVIMGFNTLNKGFKTEFFAIPILCRETASAPDSGRLWKPLK